MLTAMPHGEGMTTTTTSPAATWPEGSPLFARALFQAACSAAGDGFVSRQNGTTYHAPADALDFWMRQPGIRRLVTGA